MAARQDCSFHAWWLSFHAMSAGWDCGNMRWRLWQPDDKEGPILAVSFWRCSNGTMIVMDIVPINSRRETAGGTTRAEGFVTHGAFFPPLHCVATVLRRKVGCGGIAPPWCHQAKHASVPRTEFHTHSKTSFVDYRTHIAAM